MSKCPQCGADNSNSYMVGGHEVNGEFCAKRQLAQAQAKIERLAAIVVQLLTGLDEHWVTTEEGRFAVASAKAAKGTDDEAK